MTGEDILIEYDYEDTNVGLWIGILIIMFVVYRIGFFIMLSRSYKHD